MTTWTLVTGGAKGLGAAICVKLASCGFNPVIHYRHNREKADEVARVCRLAGVEADVCQGEFSSQQTVQDFVSRYQASFGDTGSLINSVGIFLRGPASTTSGDHWRELFQVNLHAPVAITQALLPSLRHHAGTVVNIGMAGVQHSYPDIYCSAYLASKCALWQVSRSLARELAPVGVRVNMVSPGYLEDSIDMPSSVERLPMMRLGTLQEVSDVVAFLLSSSASYITGQNIEVAGAIRL